MAPPSCCRFLAPLRQNCCRQVNSSFRLSLECNDPLRFHPHQRHPFRPSLRPPPARRGWSAARAAPGTQRLLVVCAADTGGGATAAGVVGCTRRYPRSRGAGRQRRRRARRQPPAARHEAGGRLLRWPPVRTVGRPARRRSRDRAGRPDRAGWPTLGVAAEGGWSDALFTSRRRSCRAALVAARIRLQRGDASPRCADDARAGIGRNRRRRTARHVLRRPCRNGARRDRHALGAVVRALRQLRDLRIAR